jgi:murein DD-endopeptidase MepM/ murein hydrolase activator NlpD
VKKNIKITPKIFFRNFRHPYLLILRRIDNLEIIFSLYLTRLRLFLFIALFILILIVLTTLLIAYTPLRQYIPGYGDIEEKEMAYNLAKKTDSLVEILEQREIYYKNLHTLLTTVDTSYNKTLKTFYYNPENISLNKIKLFHPISNIKIIKKFNENPSPKSIKISTNASENIKAMNDGVVIDTSYITSMNAMQVIMQHDNMITIYKNLAKINVGIGDKVKNNEIIGTAKPESSFIEISVFINGDAVNPENFWQ